jgi:lipopolysaccharide/colanic/teichoic acid biosynthesis glycosyltransferase
LKVIGFLDLKAEKAGRCIDGVPVYHQEGSLADSVTALRPRVLIVAMKRGRFYELAEDLTWCAQQGIEIWDVPTAFEHLEKRIPLPYVDEIWLLNSAINWPRVTTYRIKRLMDLFLASFGILITSPIMIAISAAIRIESRGPSILLQQRIGKHGRVFDLYKFRSMYQSRPMEGDKGTNDVLDRRITRVGRVIRPLHLDELPQLFNVLLGDLSLVGPRAELYDFICDYVGRRSHFISHWQDKKKPPPSCETTGEPDLVRSAEMAPFIPYIEQRFTVDQGITGWAQVMHPYVTSSYEDMVRKLEYDLYYIKNMSTLLDLIIIFMTVRLILTGKGK